MRKRTGSFEAWYCVLALLCVITGVGIGLRWKIQFPNELTALKVNAVTFPFALAVIFSLVASFITSKYVKKRQADHHKSLARKAVKQTFDVLCATNRALENADAKSHLIINSGANGTFDKMFMHELIQSSRDQLVEIYYDLSACIEDWRDILPDEFDRIEKRERLLDMLTTEQMIKSMRLKELEKDGIGNEKEILALKTELVKLAERLRSSRTDIISESKELVGAPITTRSKIQHTAPTQILVEQTLVQQLFLNKDCAKNTGLNPRNDDVTRTPWAALEPGDIPIAPIDPTTHQLDQKHLG